MKRIFQIAAATVLFGAPAQAVTIDLVTNGDFEAGNTGFSTDLTYSPSSLTSAGVYAVVPDGNALHASFASFGDHTSGSGNMMAINGTTTNGTVAWEQTVSVLSGKTYEFSFWLANLFTGGSSALEFVVDGTTVGPATTTAGITGDWALFNGSWLAASDGNVAIQIVENSAAFVGNDYALDDISFTTDMTVVKPVPLPASVWLLGLGFTALFGLRRKQNA